MIGLGTPGCAPTGGARGGPFLIVLGIAQDGGAPQAGRFDDPRWDRADGRRELLAELA